MHGRNIAVLVANSVEARLLRRDHDTGELKTFGTIEDGHSVRSVNPRGSTEDERLRRQRVGAFIHVIVAHLRELHAGQAFEGVVVTAPARMLGDLEAAVAHVSPVLATLAKDLVKIPDHELASHVQHILFEADAASAS